MFRHFENALGMLEVRDSSRLSTLLDDSVASTISIVARTTTMASRRSHLRIVLPPATRITVATTATATKRWRRQINWVAGVLIVLPIVVWVLNDSRFIVSVSIPSSSSSSLTSSSSSSSPPSRPSSSTTTTTTTTTTFTLSILELPELTSWLIGNYTTEAMEFYDYCSSSSTYNSSTVSSGTATTKTRTLNEELGEIWIHRGFQQLLQQQQKSNEPQGGDVFSRKNSNDDESDNITTTAKVHWWQQRNHPPNAEFHRHYDSSGNVNDSLQPQQPTQHHYTVIVISAYLHLNQYLYKTQQKKWKRKRKRNVGPPYSTDEVIDILRARIVDSAPTFDRNGNARGNSRRGRNRHNITTTTYILAVPTWNPKRGNDIGLSKIQQQLFAIDKGIGNTDSDNNHRYHIDHRMTRYMSLGYERNIYWQKVPSPHDIIPIPYVVFATTTTTPKIQTTATVTTAMMQQQQQQRPRKKERPINIFYVGDTRPNAVKWSGCNRTALLQPLVDQYHSSSRTPLTSNNSSSPAMTNRNQNYNIFVRLIDSKKNSRRPHSDHKPTNHSIPRQHHERLSMTECNDIIRQSKYCLIVCGDTPTSRSLSSAIVHGCTPLFLGIERWYGYCSSSSTDDGSVSRPPVFHPGWGWNVLHDEHHAKDNNDMSNRVPSTITKNHPLSHFPYETIFDNDHYSHLPSIDEYDFIQDPVRSVQLFLNSDKSKYRYNHNQKHVHVHEDDDDVTSVDNTNHEDFRSSYIYGYGHPITTPFLGNAVQYIWESIMDHIRAF